MRVFEHFEQMFFIIFLIISFKWRNAVIWKNIIDGVEPPSGLTPLYSIFSWARLSRNVYIDGLSHTFKENMLCKEFLYKGGKRKFCEV